MNPASWAVAFLLRYLNGCGWFFGDRERLRRRRKSKVRDDVTQQSDHILRTPGILEEYVQVQPTRTGLHGDNVVGIFVLCPLQDVQAFTSEIGVNLVLPIDID